MKPNRNVEPLILAEEPPAVVQVLEAIDRLLDAMESFDAPITRELLRTAMMALVQECHLGEPRSGKPN
jgi:hypothetical protein